MSTQKHIVGNWKMHGSPAMATTLAKAIRDQVGNLPKSVEVTLCPPFVFLKDVAAVLSGSSVRLGGQDCHLATEGAHTGDISAPMLKSMGCSHVIVGHSERRAAYGEGNATVLCKAQAAMGSSLIPIICVGESLAEREAGGAEAVVGRQVKESLPHEGASSHFMLAYEPVWAIGSGQTPTADDIRQMHAYIKKVAGESIGLAPGQVPVLYGGSVKAANAAEILSTEGVNGVLVGGASLKADEFGKIIAAAGK